MAQNEHDSDEPAADALAGDVLKRTADALETLGRLFGSESDAQVRASAGRPKS